VYYQRRLSVSVLDGSRRRHLRATDTGTTEATDADAGSVDSCATGYAEATDSDTCSVDSCATDSDTCSVDSCATDSDTCSVDSCATDSPASYASSAEAADSDTCAAAGYACTAGYATGERLLRVCQRNWHEHRPLSIQSGAEQLHNSGWYSQRGHGQLLRHDKLPGRQRYRRSAARLRSVGVLSEQRHVRRKPVSDRVRERAWFLHQQYQLSGGK
jgi:hypothetical protein